MNSSERHEARYQRRKAARDAAQEARVGFYDDFGRITSIDNLYQAFKDCMKNVAWKESVQRYQSNALKNVADTHNRLIAGETLQNGFVEFDLHERGKIRHIKSIHISERVIQKCLCDQVVVPIITNTLIYDNGASVINKGVHFALRRLITHLAKFYRHNGRSNDGYALLIDFSKFFDSINHEILFRLQDKVIKDPNVRHLLRKYISVFGDGVSLGLGSQVSQISAIFYPNTLDHFIKEKLRIKYYGRYMDDLYLIHHDKEYLRYCLREIEKHCDGLKLTINKNKTQIVRLRDGLVFLKGKYRLLPSGKILRRPCKGSAQRMKRKLRKFRQLIIKRKMKYHDVRTAYQSWRGNFQRRFDAHYQIRFMDRMYYDIFIAGHGDQGKYPIFTRGYITPVEYRLITGKPYPDKEKVFVLDNDDAGTSFWTTVRYGKIKHSELPMVCKLKNTKRPRRWRPPENTAKNQDNP
ncbi:MAG: RNA-directed DNA polymerase [Treponema sp.]|jgi:hypothetical protein|nr:RNA-directed DNA polymerase [Treponema sp.]